MKLTRIAAGTATLIVLAAQSAAAQPAPPPAPDQPARRVSSAAPAGPTAAAARPGKPPRINPARRRPAHRRKRGPPPAVVNTNVNLRQGPGTNLPVMTIPAGAPVRSAVAAAMVPSHVSRSEWLHHRNKPRCAAAQALSAGLPAAPAALFHRPITDRTPYGYYGPGPYWRHRGYYGAGIGTGKDAPASPLLGAEMHRRA